MRQYASAPSCGDKKKTEFYVSLWKLEDVTMPKNRRANATLFGFDFQRNAAIVLMLENIKELKDWSKLIK